MVGYYLLVQQIGGNFYEVTIIIIIIIITIKVMKRVQVVVSVSHQEICSSMAI